MKITDLLKKDVMILDLQATTKEVAIDEMIAKLFDQQIINDKAGFKADILAREAQSSTGLGDGIALPHAKNKAVQSATVLFAKSANSVDYGALDGNPVNLFFMIAAPEGANDTHLKALSSLATFLIDPDFVASLKTVTTAEDVIQIFEAKEALKKAESEVSKSNDTNDDRPYVVAVTGCPTGIAHTYMAEEALKKMADQMGVDIKVETNGSRGIEHLLTDDEIKKSVGVIVAADKKVAMNRFDGKKLLNVPVSDGIKRPEELITKIVKGDAGIFHGKASAEHSSSSDSTTGTLGQKIYKDLMNGVSHMLPFVIGGGIMIALAFLIDQTMGVPTDKLAQLGSYHQAAQHFKGIGDAAFGFMLPVLAGYIASSIADRPGLVVGFVAGALANTGGAGFLGALIGGFLAGYVIVFLEKVLKNLPKSLDGIKAILFYPVFGVLITGFAMLLINIPMKMINTGLNDFLTSLGGANAILLGALLGGMMAIDLGGPINKAAYIFGTASIAATVTEGGSIIMASVMAGGMVPPLAIFVATLLFKNKFSKEDRQAGLTNLIMGASFITEGAIPFAASDPLRALPSFVVGSALTGGLVGALSIRLLAPHGGIFVILLTNQPLLYVLFILIGAIVSGIIYGLLLKPVEA